jgi:hypothetical protein
MLQMNRIFEFAEQVLAAESWLRVMVVGRGKVPAWFGAVPKAGLMIFAARRTKTGVR